MRKKIARPRRKIYKIRGIISDQVLNPLTTIKGFLELKQQGRTLNQKTVDLMMDEIEKIEKFIKKIDP